MNLTRIFIISFVYLLTSLGNSATAQTPDEIAAHIFLGQAYPSGNIYLELFPLPNTSHNEDDYLKSYSWPNSISYHALSSTHAYSNKLRVGHLSTIMHDEKEDLGTHFLIKSAHIPGLESMDEEHEGCSKSLYKTKNPRFTYLGDEFFDQELFNCNSNEGISIYKNTETSNYSFSVVAFSDKAQLTEIKLLGEVARPLTPDESAAVEKDKKKLKSLGLDCTTDPTYRDSAKILLSAKVKGADISIRISRYRNPGCLGHLASIYLLDVLKAGKLLESYELVQYEGVV